MFEAAGGVNHIFYRLLPNIIALILFCTYLLPQIGSGPLWPNIIEHHADLCKKYMWRNFLFIHNFYGFNNMCLTHTHQVGIDMQLFLITPPLVYLVWKNKKIGIWTLIIFGISSTALRFWTLYTNELITIIHHGISVSKMFDASSLSYILPTHRVTIYFYGILTAYFLKYLKPKVYLTSMQWVLLWCISSTCFFLTWLGPYHMVKLDYQYDVLEGALISALYPIIWGPCMAFLIYATIENAAWYVGSLLNWKYFQIFTKIGYAVYLVQFPVFFYNVGLRRHTAEYHLGLLLEPSETFLIFAISTILVLCVEMPFQNIKQSILNKEKIPKQTLRKSKTG